MCNKIRYQTKWLVTPEKSFTYLGFEIDETISWNKQTEILKTSILHSYWQNNFNLLQPFSVLYYIGWFNSLVLHVSKKCMKIFVPHKNVSFFNSQEQTAPVFKTFKILKLHGIIQLNVLKLIYFTSMISYYWKSKIFQSK